MSATTKLTGTDLIHGDESHKRHEVAPSISVTTTFRAPHPDEGLKYSDFDPLNPPRHVYSRYTQSNSTAAEKILSKIHDGYALTYASGLAASFSAVLHYNPKRIAIGGGYHGVHAGIEIYKKANPNVQIINIDDTFQSGDLCWLETPLNPTGESRNIKYYADKIHAVGGKLLVDSTFGPPPLQYPFKWGTDCIMHSGTKYFGGHSDMLCGVLVVKTREEWVDLWTARTYMGNMLGSLEAWLLLRSLRTLHLRVPRQSQTATELAQWLFRVSKTPVGQEYDGIPGGLVVKVWHSSIQAETANWDIKGQMEGGWNATFSILMKDKDHASLLPHLLHYFVAATSLGGVESLIEQRATTDPGADPRLVRISVGVEDLEDLKNDLRRALNEVAAKAKAKL